MLRLTTVVDPDPAAATLSAGVTLPNLCSAIVGSTLMLIRARRPKPTAEVHKTERQSANAVVALVHDACCHVQPAKFVAQGDEVVSLFEWTGTSKVRMRPCRSFGALRASE